MNTINKFLLILLVGMLFIVVGCSNKEFDKAMENGKNAVEDNDYAEATNYFEKAVNEKKDHGKAKSFFMQSENMESGLQNFNLRKFDKASDNFDSILAADEEYLILKDEAEEQLVEIDKKKNLVEELKDRYEKAKELKDAGDYKDALNVVEEELNKDLSHDSLDKEKDDLKSLKEEIDDIDIAYDEVKELLEEEKYKEGMDLVDETLNQNDVFGEKMHEFDKLYAELQSNIPSPDPYKIHQYEGEYIYVGG